MQAEEFFVGQYHTNTILVKKSLYTLYLQAEVFFKVDKNLHYFGEEVFSLFSFVQVEVFLEGQ